MARFSLHDFNCNQRLLKTSVETVERLTALRKNLTAVAKDIGNAGFYDAEFTATDGEHEVVCSVQDWFENLVALIETHIDVARADADFASMQLAKAIFGGDSDD